MSMLKGAHANAILLLNEYYTGKRRLRLNGEWCEMYDCWFHNAG